MTRTRRVKALAIGMTAVVVFFIPAPATIVFGFVVRDFVPTSKLQTPAVAVGAIAAAFFAWAIARTTMNELRVALSARRFNTAAANAALIAFSPVFGFVINYVFFAGPVSYGVHRASEGPVLENTHRVLYADRHGHARCRNRVILSGDELLWTRQLCSVPDEVVGKLARGGVVITRGFVSAYGERVQSYQVAVEPTILSIDTDPQQLEAASPQMSVVRSYLRYH